jgi:hypothetical protein
MPKPRSSQDSLIDTPITTAYHGVSDAPNKELTRHP